MALPGDDTLKWLISRYATLRLAAGDAFEGAVLVTPTGEHFPDQFERDADSVARLLRRMMTYTPIADSVRVELGFFEPDEAEASGGGGCGSCGPTSCGPTSAAGAKATSRVDAVSGGYRLALSVADVSDPVVLTSTVARSLGAMLLAESAVDDVEDIATDSEIAAAASGFGVLVASAAHIYGKSCGGVSVRRNTALSLDEATFVLALFCAVHEIKPSKARSHLGPSQREAFAESVDLVDKNPALVAALRDAPETLTDGIVAIAHERSFFARLFARRPEPEFASAGKRALPRSEEDLRRLAEAKALVEEALGES